MANDEVVNIINDFNEMMFDLANQLSMACPSSFIANNLDILKRIINSHPKKIIDIFVLYILKYKQRIDDGDDDFFINNDFSSEINDIGENDLVGKVFEFKTMWKQLTHTNRVAVKNYMQCLCQLSLEYTFALNNPQPN